MAESFWKQTNYWWVSIVLLLLSGAGWAIKTYWVEKDKPATLIVKVNPPPGKVTLYIDSEIVVETSEYGFRRIKDLPPGEHEIQWKVEGYASKVANIKIEGGKENRIELPKLEPVGAEGHSAEPTREADIVSNTEVHKWFAGTTYNGVIDLSEQFGHIWKCSGGTCVLEGPYGTGLNMEACRAVSAIAGPLEYYYNDSGMTWSATSNPEMLAQCNQR